MSLQISQCKGGQTEKWALLEIIASFKTYKPLSVKKVYEEHARIAQNKDFFIFNKRKPRFDP